MSSTSVSLSDISSEQFYARNSGFFKAPISPQMTQKATQKIAYLILSFGVVVFSVKAFDYMSDKKFQYNVTSCPQVDYLENTVISILKELALFF